MRILAVAMSWWLWKIIFIYAMFSNPFFFFFRWEAQLGITNKAITLPLDLIGCHCLFLVASAAAIQSECFLLPEDMKQRVACCLLSTMINYQASLLLVSSSVGYLIMTRCYPLALTYVYCGRWLKERHHWQLLAFSHSRLLYLPSKYTSPSLYPHTTNVTPYWNHIFWGFFFFPFIINSLRLVFTMVFFFVLFWNI